MTEPNLSSYSIPPEARAQMMAALALAWDGQWFLKVYERLGWDAAADINARVRASFAKLEMRATLRALGKRSADNLADALAVWQAYLQMFGAEVGAFMGEQFIEDGTILNVTVTKCAAWEGARRANLERSDQACIACETVWLAWFGALLPERAISLDIISRMGHGAPQCGFRIRAIPPQK